MSWRDTLGVAASPTDHLDTHNTHNPQNASASASAMDHSADIADSASTGSEDSDSKLLEALASACHGLPIDPQDVRAALAPADIDAWRRGEINGEALAAFARSLTERREMDQGKCPASYTETATCKHCGPIWLWVSGEVSGCPWCWNRLADRPIPRPHKVQCGKCVHFRRTAHPHLGHCAKGEPEAVAGLWDTDRRYCERYLPATESEYGGVSRPSGRGQKR